MDGLMQGVETKLELPREITLGSSSLVFCLFGCFFFHLDSDGQVHLNTLFSVRKQVYPQKRDYCSAASS